MHLQTCTKPGHDYTCLKAVVFLFFNWIRIHFLSNFLFFRSLPNYDSSVLHLHHVLLICHYHTLRYKSIKISKKVTVIILLPVRRSRCSQLLPIPCAFIIRIDLFDLQTLYYEKTGEECDDLQKSSKNRSVFCVLLYYCTAIRVVLYEEELYGRFRILGSLI